MPKVAPVHSAAHASGSVLGYHHLVYELCSPCTTLDLTSQWKKPPTPAEEFVRALLTMAPRSCTSGRDDPADEGHVRAECVELLVDIYIETIQVSLISFQPYPAT